MRLTTDYCSPPMPQLGQSPHHGVCEHSKGLPYHWDLEGWLQSHGTRDTPASCLSYTQKLRAEGSSALASLFCCWVTSAPLHAGAAAARELCAELTFGRAELQAAGASRRWRGREEGKEGGGGEGGADLHGWPQREARKCKPSLLE